MENGRLGIYRGGNRGGFILLVFIVGMALLVVMYAISTGSLNPFASFQGTAVDRYSDPNAMPWEESHLFTNELLDGYDMGGRRPPFRGQAKLKEGFRYVIELYKGEESRGQLKVVIDHRGEVSSEWSGEFSMGENQYKVRPGRRVRTDPRFNMFDGNIAPLKIYENEEGKDKSKLYFLATGVVQMEASGEEKSISGMAYLAGWISKKRSAEGKLYILSGSYKNAEIFEWGPVESEEPED